MAAVKWWVFYDDGYGNSTLVGYGLEREATRAYDVALKNKYTNTAWVIRGVLQHLKQGEGGE